MKPYRNKLAGRNTAPKSRVVQTEPVEVYCRIRPLSNPNDVSCLRAESERFLQLIPPEIFQKQGVVLQYTFSYVFDEKSTQNEVFSHVALPLVEDLLNGKNGLLFTYGVTSSGKTYTMTGIPEQSGILPLCLDVIFNTVQFNQTKKFVFKPNRQNGFRVQTTGEAVFEQQREICQMSQKTPGLRKRNMLDWSRRSGDTRTVVLNQPDYVYAVFISFVEIYNNYVYDLLDDGLFEAARGKLPQSKTLREDSNRHMYVSDTIEVEVKNADEAFEVFLRGQQRRKVAHTALNTESSRSHSVFVIKIVQAAWDTCGDEVDMSVTPVVSQLSLVDLAGSERSGRTRNAGSRLKEAGNINNSLMVLRQCIELLREKQMNNSSGSNKVVPYRDNKLTHLFKSFFEGEGHVRMIVCANPGIDEFDETFQAMRFAEIAQELRIPRQPQRPPVPPKVIRVARTDSATILTLGPAYPEIVFNCPDDAQALKTLEEFLLARINCKNQALQTYAQKQMSIREQIVQFQSEYNIMKQQVLTLKMDLAHRVEQLANMERKCGEAEQAKESLKKSVTDLERTKRSLQSQLREKEHRINSGKVNQLKLQANMQDQLEMERDRMRRMMEHRLAAKEAELQAKMCLSEEKIRMLRDILNSGDDWAFADVGFSHQGVTTHSDTQLQKAGTKMVGMTTPSRNALSRSDPKLTGTKTPGRVGIPAANPRHKRSISAGADRWLEHVPVGSVNTGTVFQPQLKKKKSVSKLDPKDIMESSKYVLTHQEHREGTDQVQTHLFKGNVIPSSGGGAQVIFDDVEVLKQSSPPHGYSLRKRSAEKMEESRNGDTRCGPAIENKVLLKKTRV